MEYKMTWTPDAIIQSNLDWSFEKSWESIEQIIDELTCDPYEIIQCCEWKRESTIDYKREYYFDDPQKEANYLYATMDVYKKMDDLWYRKNLVKKID